LRPQVNVRFSEYSRLKQFYSLNALTDLIVEVWSIGRVCPNGVAFRSIKRRSVKVELNSETDEVNRQEHLALTVGPDKTWSHQHLQLSTLRDEKHEARTVGIWRNRGPNLATNYGDHEGILGGKRGILSRVGASLRRSPGITRAVTRGAWDDQKGLQESLMAKIAASQMTLEKHEKANEKLRRTNEELWRSLR